MSSISIEGTSVEINRPSSCTERTPCPALVFLHGFAAPASSYKDLMSEISGKGIVTANLRTCYPLCRGEGGARKMQTVARWLDCQPWISSVGSCGHSWGGEQAIVAAKDPTIRFVVGISPTPPDVLHKPTLFIYGTRDHIGLQARGLENHLPDTTPYAIAKIQEAYHWTFMWPGPWVERITAWARCVGEKDSGACQSFDGMVCGQHRTIGVENRRGLNSRNIG